MPSFCPVPLRPATQDAQNTVHRFWVSGGGIGVPPGTGVSPVGKRDPPELPNIFGERFLSVPMIPNRKKTKNEEYGAPPLMGYPPQGEI